MIRSLVSGPVIVRALSIAALLVVCLVNLAAQRSAAAEADVAAIIEPLQVSSPADAAKTFDALVESGPEGIAKLVAMLVEPGQGSDLKARLAIAGLAQYSSRPGADAERRLVAKALADGLSTASAPSGKILLLQQLQFIGTKDIVPTVSPLLGDPELAAAAAYTLQSIRGPESREALQKALLAAKGPTRLPLAGAVQLWRNPDPAVVAKLIEWSKDNDPALKLTALRKLARSGRAEAAEPLVTGLTPALKGESRAAQGEAVSIAATYLSRLGRQSRGEEAHKLAEQLGGLVQDESLKKVLTTAAATPPRQPRGR